MPKNANKAISSTLEVLNNLREQGVTKAEVEIAKQNLVSSYKLALKDPDVLASIILNNQVSGHPPEILHQTPDQIQAVTWEQVNQVAKDLIYPDKIVVVTVGGSN